MPDQVRQAQFDAFTSEPLGLPVQGLMLAMFFEDEHGDQAVPGPSANITMALTGLRPARDLRSASGVRHPPLKPWPKFLSWHHSVDLDQ